MGTPTVGSRVEGFINTRNNTANDIKERKVDMQRLKVQAPRYWETGDEDQSFRYNNYLSRYHWRHLDVMDVLSGFQGRARASLSDTAVLLGYPHDEGITRNGGRPGGCNFPLVFKPIFGDNGRGVGASHQTGWTGVVAKLLQPRRESNRPDDTIRAARPRQPQPREAMPA